MSPKTKQQQTTKKRQDNRRQSVNQGINRQLIQQPLDPKRILNPDRPLTPENALQLQRTIGNKATAQIVQQRQQQESVQRLAFDEEPINATNLKNVTCLHVEGGERATFLLESEAGHKLIVKFDDQFKHSLFASEIHKQVGGKAPSMRKASQDSRQELYSAVSALKDKEPDAKKFITAYSKSRLTMVLMEHAEGRAADKITPDEFREIIKDPGFQKELGNILATDALTGEWDRLHAYHQFGDLAVRYNPGNIIINGGAGGYQVIPIDNAFKPALSSLMPNREGMGSMTVLRPKELKQEVEAIYKRIRPDISESGDREFDAKHKKDFIKNVTQSARDTLPQLLARGQHWRALLGSLGASEEEINNFKLRRRFMRIINFAPKTKENEIFQTIKDSDKYHEWVLTKELKFSKKKAKDILEQGDYVYRLLVSEARKTGKRYSLKEYLKKKLKLSSKQIKLLMRLDEENYNLAPKTEENEIFQILKDSDKYREWMLNKELKFSKETAKEILEQGDYVYRLLVSEALEKGKRYSLKEYLKKKLKLNPDQIEQIVQMDEKNREHTIENILKTGEAYQIIGSI